MREACESRIDFDSLQVPNRQQHKSWVKALQTKKVKIKYLLINPYPLILTFLTSKKSNKKYTIQVIQFNYSYTHRVTLGVWSVLDSQCLTESLDSWRTPQRCTPTLQLKDFSLFLFLGHMWLLTWVRFLIFDFWFLLLFFLRGNFTYPSDVWPLLQIPPNVQNLSLRYIKLCFSSHFAHSVQKMSILPLTDSKITTPN